MLQRVLLRAVATRKSAGRRHVQARVVAPVKNCCRSFAAESKAASKPVAVKATTGMAGLDVQPMGREILTKLYENMLVVLGQMPEEAAYRVHMERVLNYRLEVLRTTESILDIEEKLEDGQIEEMIEDAEEELEMLPKFIADKPWEQDKWHHIPAIWSNIKL